MNDTELINQIADALTKLDNRMKRLESAAFPDRVVCNCCKGHGSVFNKRGESVVCNFCNGCGDRLFKGKS